MSSSGDIPASPPRETGASGDTTSGVTNNEESNLPAADGLPSPQAATRPSSYDLFGSDDSSSDDSSSDETSDSDDSEGTGEAEKIRRIDGDSVFKDCENDLADEFLDDASVDCCDSIDGKPDKKSIFDNNDSDDSKRGLLFSSQNLPMQKIPLRKLPMVASQFFFRYQGLVERRWTNRLKEMLNATRSQQSAFSLLRDHEETLVRKIYEYVSYPKGANHVRLTVPAEKIIQGQSGFELWDDYNIGVRDPAFVERQEILRSLPVVSDGYSDGYVAFASLGCVAFPAPIGRNVNMMPFRLGHADSLPDDLKCYYPLIEKCHNNIRSGVAYLTIEEGYVEANATQRRPGLHMEAPRAFGTHQAAIRPGRGSYWGGGYFVGADQYYGGVYCASSLGSTSRVFNALVDKRVQGLSDPHGGCENLRRFIGEGKVLDANELVWMTDQTPHEALPQQQPGYRQFFRLVMPEISHWYAKHSTPNPKVPIPDGIVVIEESKF